MRTRSSLALTASLGLALVACGPQKPTPGPSPSSQSATQRHLELDRLFDRCSAPDEAAANEAAAASAVLTAADRDYFDGLWGVRGAHLSSARRVGRAAFAKSDHARAERWLRRAIEASGSEAHFDLRATLRCDLAEVLIATGRARDAVELLSNRPDPRPLPQDIHARTQAILRSLRNN